MTAQGSKAKLYWLVDGKLYRQGAPKEEFVPKKGTLLTIRGVSYIVQSVSPRINLRKVGEPATLTLHKFPQMTQVEVE